MAYSLELTCSRSRIVVMVENKLERSGSTLVDHEQITPEQTGTEKIGKQYPRVTELEITREVDRLKLSFHEQTPGEESTIRHYEEMPVSMEMIQTKCHGIVGALNKANRQGRLSPEVLTKLTEIGQVFR